MAKCRNCGQAVEFKPHPKNKEKLAPFDADGEIHFAKCKTEKPKVEYKQISDIGFCSGVRPSANYEICSLPIVYVADFIIAGGDVRLVAMCHQRHRRQIHVTDGNRKLINHMQVSSNHETPPIQL